MAISSNPLSSTAQSGRLGHGCPPHPAPNRTINPDLERFMAKRMGAKTIEVKASHLSLISHPDEITQLILGAAASSTIRTATPGLISSPMKAKLRSSMVLIYCFMASSIGKCRSKYVNFKIPKIKYTLILCNHPTPYVYLTNSAIAMKAKITKAVLAMTT
jgi:hypothetical protein